MTRRWRWKRALVALLIGGPIALIILLVAAVLLLPVIVTDETVKREAVSALTETLGTPVEIERVSYHPLSGIEVFGIVIGPPSGFTKDVARIDRVAILYDLSNILSFSVTVNEVAVERPRLTIEAVKMPNGTVETNLDAIAKKMAKDAAPEEEPKAPKEPLVGPLSPIDVVLEKFSLTALSVEKVGEGPHLSLFGLSILADAVLDQEKLHAGLTLSIAPAGAASNLTFDDPAKSLSASLQLALTATTSIDAAASDGFDLGRLVFGLKSALDGDVVVQGNALPKLDVDMIGGLGVVPRDDRIIFAPLRLHLSNATVVDLSASVVGLEAAFAELLGPIVAQNLAAQLGLVRQRPDDVATLSVATIALPLDVLSPYAAVFLPGLVAKGTIALAPLEVSGTLLEVLRGNPRGLRLRLGFEEVAVEFPPADVRVRKLGGGINLARSDDGKFFGLEGSLAMEGLSQLANSAERAFVSVRAKAERLTYPPPGETEVELVLSAEGVRAPPATVHRASINVLLKGADVLHHDRAELPPVEASVVVKADLVRAEENEVRGLALSVRALADRLLLPTKQPIESVIALSLGSASVAGGISTSGVKLNVEVKLSDPRMGAPIDTDTKLLLSAAAVDTPEVALDNAKIELATTANAIARRMIPPLAAPIWAPAYADVELAVALPTVVVHDENYGDVPASVLLKTNFSADLVQGSVALRSLALDLWDLLRVRTNGRFARLLTQERFVDAVLEIQPIDLARLLDRVPQVFVDRVLPGLVASGKLGLTARAKGNVPEVFGKIDLGAPPLEAHVALTSEDVLLSMPSKKTDVEGFSGRVAIDVARGKSELTTNLVAKKLGFAASPDTETWLEDVTLKARAGLRGEMWEISTDLDARGKENASFDIDLTYVKHGEMMLRRFDIRLPGTGIELDIAGRLARRTFGVFRPELALKAKIDFDRFGDLYEGAGALHGVVGLNVDITSPNDRRAVVAGVLELAGFGYEDNKLLVKGATGRIPIDQRLALKAPIMRELVARAEGVLGDDLERRLQELQDELMFAKLIVDKDDILLEAPRSADYQPLRPYYAEKGAHLSIEQVMIGPDTFRNVVLDGLYRSGVLRADRFAAQVWDGDILGDLAVQVTADLNVRLRQRGTITGLNLDIPYSQAKLIAPVKDPKKKEEYEVAGTSDLRFLLHERSVTMKLDLKLRKPTLERLLGYLDPKGTNPGMTNARWALSVSEAVGLRPVAGQFTIAQNLVSMNIEWARAWLPEWLGDWTSIFTLLRVATIPLVGSLIVGNVNGALGDKTSIGPFIVPVIAGLGLEEKLEKYLGGRVIAEDLNEPAEVRTASP